MGKILLAIVNKLLLWIFLGIEKLNNVFSPVGGSTFFKNQQFDWIPEVEAFYPEIKQELQQVLANERLPNFQDVSPEQKVLTTDDRWKTFFFWGYGTEIEENCRKCPKTAEALRNIPGLKTAMFSILSPHKHVPPHRGPYNGVLRYHLGLQIPGDGKQCRIRVGDDIHAWKEGQSVVFDDSFDHEAWNDTDEVRVVLFVDFVRPLPWPLNRLNNWVITQFQRSSFVTVALKNIDEWNRDFDAAPDMGDKKVVTDS